MSWRLEAPEDADIAMEIAEIMAEYPRLVNHWFETHHGIQVFSSSGPAPSHPRISEVDCVLCDGLVCERCSGTGRYLRWQRMSTDELRAGFEQIALMMET